MLQWIARIVSTIPVYRLDVIRDLERLPEVVQELMAWHGPVTVPGKVTAPLE
jgi:cytochrome P450